MIIKATNEGRTLVENAPKDQITQDFSILADRLLGRKTAPAPKAAFKLFGRQVTARA